MTTKYLDYTGLSYFWGKLKDKFLAKSGGTLTGRITTAKPINQILTGTGVAGKDNGSSASPNRYTPSTWTFNTGHTATDGDIVTVRVPIAGVSYGVWMSIDNGTNYYPIARQGTTRLQTQFGVGISVTLIYEASASVSVYALNGSDSSSTVTGGTWRVLNFYYSDTTYTAMSDAEVTAGTSTSNRTITPARLKLGVTTHAPVQSVNSKTGTVTLGAADVGAVADCTISLYNGNSGNPNPIKFLTVDYNSATSEAGVLIKITMMCGHGNGVSYNYYQDAIFSVSYQGTVSCNIYRYYAASITYDSTTHYYGDIFWVIDTTNKVVDFYVLMGQYSTMKVSPLKRMNSSTGGTITQLTTATKYSSGTKNYASVFWMDGSTKQNTLVSGTNIAPVNNQSLLQGSNLSFGTVVYGETSTASSTSIKTVNIVGGGCFSFWDSALLVVKFVNGNDAGNLYLNVDGWGESYIWSNAGYISSSNPLTLNSGDIVVFFWDAYNQLFYYVTRSDDIADYATSAGTAWSTTLSASAWSNNEQTVTVGGVTASNTVIVSPAPASFEDYRTAVIYCSAQSTDSLTFTCSTTPTTNISVNVLII